MFRSLDFIYMPSSDVDADLNYYVEVLGAYRSASLTDLENASHSPAW